MVADSVLTTNTPIPSGRLRYWSKLHSYYQGQVLLRHHRLLSRKKEVTAAVSFREATDPCAGV